MLDSVMGGGLSDKVACVVVILRVLKGGGVD